MKVVNLNLYRAKRAIENLEKQIGEIALSPPHGAVNQIKSCFKEWLVKTGTSNS